MTEFVVVKYETSCGPTAAGGGPKPVKTYYGGYYAESFSNSGVIWYKTHRSRRSRFSQGIAEMAAKQLRQMGHEVEVEKLIRRERKKRDAQRPEAARPSA